MSSLPTISSRSGRDFVTHAAARSDSLIFGLVERLLGELLGRLIPHSYQTFSLSLSLTGRHFLSLSLFLSFIDDVCDGILFLLTIS